MKTKKGILPKKIQDAVDRGELIPYEEIKKKWSPEKRVRIETRARYLKAAMELRELRKKRKLSQSALAKKMHVKREFISRIESGTQNITLETLYRIGEAMGKKVEVNFK
jgi:DNA-binding XRE family transcriptional regulator